MKTIIKNSFQVAFFVILVTAVLNLAGPRFYPTPHHFVPVRNVIVNQ